MGAGVANSLRGCLDCDDLLSGASRRLVPHQYLVLSRRLGGSGRMEYQCLVCRTCLVYEPGADPTWSIRDAADNLAASSPAAEPLNETAHKPH